MAKDILRNRHAGVKFAKEKKQRGVAYLAVLFFQKKIKISDDTTSSLEN